MAERSSRTVTFLFTDMEGSTRLIRQLGREHYREVLSEHQRLLREVFAAHGGNEVDTQGDAFLVAFESAADAVAAAVAAQRALAGHDWPKEVQLRVRMGMHTAEASFGEERYVGLGLHRGARVGAAAHGGQVLLSATTRDLVEDDLPPGVKLRGLGSHRLKDVEQPLRLYQLVIEGLPADFPRPRTVGRPAAYRRRGLLAGALAGVIAAAVAIPIFALGRGSSSGGALPEVNADAVGVIDTHGNTVVAEVPVGAAPNGVAGGQGSVWVTNTNDESVSRIDPSTRTVRQTISVGGGPRAIAVGAAAVWVANSLDGTVSRIDPATNAVVQTIKAQPAWRSVRVPSGSRTQATRPSPASTLTRARSRPRSSSAPARPTSPWARARSG